MNLNFDMVGSPNSVRFVYDGDGDAFGTKWPERVGCGGGRVPRLLRLAGPRDTADKPSTGRSDYFGFIENGIPAGGLSTGAEDIKSAEEAAVFGGTAGLPYDPCYHAACDTTANVDPVVLEEMADAIAHSTLTFAMTTSAVNGTSKGQTGGSQGSCREGNLLKR